MGLLAGFLVRRVPGGGCVSGASRLSRARIDRQGGETARASQRWHHRVHRVADAGFVLQRQQRSRRRSGIRQARRRRLQPRQGLKDAEGPFPDPGFNPTDPDAARFPSVAHFLMKTDATFTTWLEEMRALGQPPSGRDAWSALVDAVAAHVRINRDQIDAARSGDRERSADDYDEGVATQEALLEAANDAGVPECAKVDR